jgi:hypothetical protein
VNGLKDSFVDAEVFVEEEEELIEARRVCASLPIGTPRLYRGPRLDIVSCRWLILHVVRVRDLEGEAHAES